MLGLLLSSVSKPLPPPMLASDINQSSRNFMCFVIHNFVGNLAQFNSKASLSTIYLFGPCFLCASVLPDSQTSKGFHLTIRIYLGWILFRFSIETDDSCEVLGCQNDGRCLPNRMGELVCFCLGDFAGDFCEIGEYWFIWYWWNGFLLMWWDSCNNFFVLTEIAVNPLFTFISIIILPISKLLHWFPFLLPFSISVILSKNNVLWDRILELKNYAVWRRRFPIASKYAISFIDRS